jgi:precorrin-2 dehydrogenase/sirohydrochlorin ferrochelatase
MNQLFPVFLKLEHLQTLLVGGGNVGLEKLSALLANSPNASVTVVADYFLEETKLLAASAPYVRLVERKFMMSDLDGKDIAILATDQPDLHRHIYEEARRRHLLLNVADTPHLCDFYLGAIVSKGDLKIGISTNGKSPTLAKRLKEFLNELIPDEIQPLLDNLQAYRKTLQGDFRAKVEALNRLTEEKLRI